MASFSCFAKVVHIALEFSNNNNSNGEEELKLYFYYSVCTYEQQFRCLKLQHVKSWCQHLRLSDLKNIKRARKGKTAFHNREFLVDSMSAKTFQNSDGGACLKNNNLCLMSWLDRGIKKKPNPLNKSVFCAQQVCDRFLRLVLLVSGLKSFHYGEMSLLFTACGTTEHIFCLAECETTNPY